MKAGLLSEVDAPWRHGIAYRELRRLVADGALGTVLTVHGLHPDLSLLANLVDGLLGDDPAVAVYAQGQPGRPPAFVSVTHRSGATAAYDLRAGGPAAGEGPLLTVFGTVAHVEFEPAGRLLDRLVAATGQALSETEAAGSPTDMPDDAAGPRSERVRRLVSAACRSTETGQPITLA